MSRARPNGKNPHHPWHTRPLGAEHYLVEAEDQRLRLQRLTTVMGEVQPDDPGIYFITTADSLFTKIGWVKCAQWADLRLDQLQIGNPVALRLELVVSPGTIAQERKLHRRFAALLSRGEWFRRDGELRDILNLSGCQKPLAITRLRAIIDPS